MYYVIFSKDPYLLARLCVLLQMVGIKINKEWCEVYSPFHASNMFFWMLVRPETGVEFHNHSCYTIEKAISTRLTITESNYTKVLSTIIDNKK